MLFIPAYLSLVRKPFMTATPTPRAATRPSVPTPGTDEYARWSKDSALSFTGGTVTAAYGDLVQTLDLAMVGFSCAVPTKTVSVPSSSVVRTIGQPGGTRKAFTYQKKQYNKKNSSLAAAGESIRIVTDIGEYTARLTGSTQAFADYLCTNRAALCGITYFYSARGAEYGPFTPEVV